MLEKLNEFPARQMKIIPKIANKALRELDKHDVINTLMKDAIQGQKSTENNHGCNQCRS